MIKKNFHSFDRGFVTVSSILKPDRLRFLKDKNNYKKRISRGSGLSYAAVSFGKDVCSISHKSFNRILFFDVSRKEIEVEPGITLNELYNFLIDYDLHLKIQPGYSLISVGGCVACNVHGKNQSTDGNFKDQVIGINLFHPLHGDLYLSRAENSDIFDLTCGGLGLTGHIVSVKLKLQEIVSHFYSVKRTYFADFISSVQYLELNKNAFQSIYGWHDFNIFNHRFADGIIFSADFSDDTSFNKSSKLPKTHTKNHLLPFSLFNNWSSYPLNLIFKAKNKYLNQSTQDTYSFMFPIEAYSCYYSFFGKTGFCEYQFIIPDKSIILLFDELKKFIFKNRINVSLSSTKYFEGIQSYLSFCGSGLCLALNFNRDYKSGIFLKFLDKLMIKYSCLPNLSKDSRMPRTLFDLTYPEADLFRDKLRSFDPKRIFNSEASIRLGL